MADDPRKTARDWLETAEGGPALNALGELLEARERERKANSAEARDAAQRAALAAGDDLDEHSGMLGVQRRRMLASARGELPGTLVDEREFPDLMEPGVRTTRRGRAALRNGLGRYLLDNAGALGRQLSLWASGQVINANKGFRGVLSHEPLSGADPDGGTAYDLRRATIAEAGTLAAKHGATGRVPYSVWAEAAQFHNGRVQKLQAEGLKVEPVKPMTIKSRCLKSGEDRELFEAKRQAASSAEEK